MDDALVAIKNGCAGAMRSAKLAFDTFVKRFVKDIPKNTRGALGTSGVVLLLGTVCLYIATPLFDESRRGQLANAFLILLAGCLSMPILVFVIEFFLKMYIAYARK